MPAYCIADIDVTDMSRYQRYRDGVGATIAQYGGHFLVRANPHEVKEGQWQPHRIVLIAFPTRAALDRWYASPEYAAVAPHRFEAAKTDLVFVDGID